MNNKLDYLSSLIHIRNYMSMVVNSNFKYIEKKDINDLYSKLPSLDKKIIKLILEEDYEDK